MSKISISGNNSGTGTFTIAAPSSNNNRTFSLPDEAGTALTDATNLEPQVKTSLNATGDAPLFACRAFCNFDGTVPTIRESGNVSSITDRGTGQYTINFSNSMTDNKYSLVGSARGQDGNLDESPSNFGTDFFTNAGAECSVTRNKRGSSESDAFIDVSLVNVAVFR